MSRVPQRLARLYPRWLREEGPVPEQLELAWAAFRRRQGFLPAFFARVLLDALWTHCQRRPARAGRRRRPEMSTTWQDLRFAARNLRKRPLFAAASVLTLALGVGANTLIFSVAESSLLRPLPYAQPERLVAVWSQWVDFDKTWVSPAEYALYRDGIESLGEVGAFGQATVTLGGEEAPERVDAVATTRNLLAVLGLSPALGREFTAEETASEADVVLLSHELWQRRYGSDPGILGTSVEIEGTPQTVVGILPAGLVLPQELSRNHRSEVWFPMAEPAPFDGLPANGGSHGWLVVARLAPGASLEAARAELAEQNRYWTADGIYTEAWKFRTLLHPVEEEVTGAVAPALKLLTAAVALLLVIACANLASLSLSRLLQRHRELAVRVALGAGRSQLSRLVLAESFLLALVGGALGLGLAALGLPFLRHLAADQIPRLAEASLNPRVLAFTLAVSLAAALLSGLLPALWAAGGRARTALRSGSAGQASAPWTRGLAIGGQMALAVVLLTGTGLMLRTVHRLLNLDPGFDRHAVTTFDLDLPRALYPQEEDVTAFYRRAVESLSTQPGVEAAGAIRRLPLATEMGDWGIQVEGYSPEPDERPAAEWQSASPGYFEAMGIGLREGRGFTAGDDAGAPPVMVINAAFAEKYWPGSSPLGKKVRLGGRGERPWTTVVGVVDNVTHNGLTSTPKPCWYLPQEQFHLSTGFASRGMSLVVRSSNPRTGRAAAAALRDLDPRLAVANLRTLEEVVGRSIAASRLTSLLLAAFSTLALILATVGIFGVSAAAVAQRRREMGIRISLGARPRQTVGLILAQGALPLALGLAAGVLASLFATRLLSGLLYGVGALDPLTFATAPLLIAAAALLASYLPARRAARVDPRIVLQEG